VILLAFRVERNKGYNEAAALLRRALFHYPRDFWLHFHLGSLATAPGEQVGCYRAALAVRPGSPPVLHNPGAALLAAKDLEGTARVFPKIPHSRPEIGAWPLKPRQPPAGQGADRRRHRRVPPGPGQGSDVRPGPQQPRQPADGQGPGRRHLALPPSRYPGARG